MQPLDEVELKLRPRETAAFFSRHIASEGSVTSLLNRIEELHVPAVSIAVMEEGTVISKAWGTNIEALFQAASISKALTAMGVMRLAADGVLDLDDEVNGLLRSWHLPQGEGVTVRRILSHSAGLSLSGFPGVGTDVDISTLVAILDGVPPSNTEPVRVVRTPGESYLYSGGGFVLLELLLEDVTGQPFAELMRRVLLEPLSMESSTFEQPLPQNLHSLAVSGHDESGIEIPGRWLLYPQAAGGLWTNPSELLLSVAEMLQPRRVLNPQQRDAMLAPQIVDHHGLGWALDGSWFQHGGSNAGFHSFVYGSVTHQRAAVVMTNGENGWPICTEVMSAVAEVFGWPGYFMEETADSAIDTTGQ